MDIAQRRERQRGWALVTVLFGIAGVIAVGRLRTADPQQAVERLLARVDGEAEPGLMHRHGDAFVAFLPNHGYHLTLYVGDHARFAPAEYLVVSRVDEELSLDLIAGEGEENVSVLRGPEREAYLQRAELDVASVDDVFERRFTSEGLRSLRAGR